MHTAHIATAAGDTVFGFSYNTLSSHVGLQMTIDDASC